MNQVQRTASLNVTWSLYSLCYIVYLCFLVGTTTTDTFLVSSLLVFFVQNVFQSFKSHQKKKSMGVFKAECSNVLLPAVKHDHTDKSQWKNDQTLNTECSHDTH